MVCKSPLLHAKNATDGKVFNKQVASVRKPFFRGDKSGSSIQQFLASVKPKDSLSCLQEPQSILKLCL